MAEVPDGGLDAAQLELQRAEQRLAAAQDRLVELLRQEAPDWAPIDQARGERDTA